MVVSITDTYAPTKNTVAIDLPGRYPTTSSAGHKYIFIMYDLDSNYIKAVPMKSRETSEMLRCYQEGYNFFSKAGFKPVLVKANNELSNRLKDEILSQGLNYEMVSPGDHRQLPAERAIQDFKNHFISVRSGTDAAYPANCWHHLLEHIEVTLNLLCASRYNPKVNAYTIIRGLFDFNRTPLAPAGCKTIVHDRPDERASWNDHGSRGFYIGPALKHYRCYTNYMPVTKATRISNTVEFFLAPACDPTPSPAVKVGMILDDLLDAVSNPIPSITGLTFNDDVTAAIQIGRAHV